MYSHSVPCKAFLAYIYPISSHVHFLQVRYYRIVPLTPAYISMRPDILVGLSFSPRVDSYRNLHLYVGYVFIATKEVFGEGSIWQVAVNSTENVAAVGRQVRDPVATFGLSHTALAHEVHTNNAQAPAN